MKRNNKINHAYIGWIDESAHAMNRIVRLFRLVRLALEPDHVGVALARQRKTARSGQL